MFRMPLIIIAIIACSNAFTISSVRKSIGGITKDNFATVTQEIEPFLLNEAGASFYKKSMKKINVKAKAFGIELSTEYARAAKATEKRRAKQDAFIQAKNAEAAEAESEEATEPELVEA